MRNDSGGEGAPQEPMGSYRSESGVLFEELLAIKVDPEPANGENRCEAGAEHLL